MGRGEAILQTTKQILNLFYSRVYEMRVNWTKKRGDSIGHMYSGYYGMVQCNFWLAEDGNQPYEIYRRSGGKKRIIIRVIENYDVSAKRRCEFLMACLSNNLDFKLLDHEVPEVTTSICLLMNNTTTPRPTQVFAGLMVGRVYKHIAKGGLYRLVLVTNIDTEKEGWIPTACYQDIFTGAAYSRPIADFNEDKYTLIPNGYPVEVDPVRFARQGAIEDV